MNKFDPNDYIDVQQRVVRFWTEYPDGAIHTELVSDPNHFEQVVFRATVWKHRDDQHPSATGYAAEMKGAGYVNQTNWHENGESSSIGRALANLGYATSIKDRPSKQEMEKAQRHSAPANGAPPVQAAPQPTQPAAGTEMTPPQWKKLWAMGMQRWPDPETCKTNLKAVIKKQYGAESSKELTKQQASQLIDVFEKNPGAIDKLLSAVDYSDTPELQDKERIA